MQKASAGLSPGVSLRPLEQHSTQRVSCSPAPGADGGVTSKTRASPPHHLSSKAGVSQSPPNGMVRDT